MNDENLIQKVLTEYTNQIVTKIHPAWLKKGAHTLAYGYPEQSLFWHSVNAALIGLNLLNYFQQHEHKLLVDPHKLLLFLTLHDMNKYLDIENQKAVSEDDVRQLLNDMQLDTTTFSPDLTIEQLAWLVQNHHLFSRGNAWKGKFVGNSEMLWLLKLSYIADGLATMTNPLKVFSDPEKPSDRVVNTAFEEWFKGYTFGYHRINYISGYATNLLHTCVAELLVEADSRIQPLCYFPDGYLYIMPKESEGKAKSITLETVVGRFGDKFKDTLAQRGQVTAYRKNVVSRVVPTEFAFLLEPNQILDSALAAVLQWHKKDCDPKQAKPFDERYAPFLKKMPELADHDQHERQVPTEPNALIDLRAIFSYLAFVWKLLDAYYAKTKADMGSEGENQSDTAKRARSDQGKRRKIDLKFVELLGVDVTDLPSVKKTDDGKTTDDADKLGLFGAIALYTRARSIPGNATPEAILQAMAEQARSVEDILRDLNERAKKLFEDVENKEKLQALAKNSIISQEVADEYQNKLTDDQPVVQVLAPELIETLREYFSLMGQQSQPSISSGKAKCSTCGRLCDGIELSATITAGGTVKTYSNANMVESIDAVPRQVCALCFCENVLRRVLCGQAKSPLYLFVFPEYVFTPYHTQFFESDIINSLFVEAHEEEKIELVDEEDAEPVDEQEEASDESEGEEVAKQEERSALLNSIQQFINEQGRNMQKELSQATFAMPVLVVPYQKRGKNVSALETWTQLFQQVLKMREHLGLKYLLADNFYPEVFGLDGVRGAIQLQGVHPALLGRLRKWTTGLRVGKQERIQRLPATTLTLEESSRLVELMQMVGELSVEAATEIKKGGKRTTNWKKENRLRLEFIRSSSIFPAADLYQSKKRRE